METLRRTGAGRGARYWLTSGGREWGRFGAFIEIFNVLNSRDHDVDYFYASRLTGEPTGGVEDIYHVFQPRSVRANLRYSF